MSIDPVILFVDLVSKGRYFGALVTYKKALNCRFHISGSDAAKLSSLKNILNCPYVDSISGKDLVDAGYSTEQLFDAQAVSRVTVRNGDFQKSCKTTSDLEALREARIDTSRIPMKQIECCDLGQAGNIQKTYDIQVSLIELKDLGFSEDSITNSVLDGTLRLRGKELIDLKLNFYELLIAKKNGCGVRLENILKNSPSPDNLLDAAKAGFDIQEHHLIDANAQKIHFEKAYNKRLIHITPYNLVRHDFSYKEAVNKFQHETALLTILMNLQVKPTVLQFIGWLRKGKSGNFQQIIKCRNFKMKYLPEACAHGLILKEEDYGKIPISTIICLTKLGYCRLSASHMIQHRYSAEEAIDVILNTNINVTREDMSKLGSHHGQDLIVESIMMSRNAVF
ncbi:hypothetical protein TetV_114 [Tetraselmis virus 1]|uniref:Uncharacterized protein n=1 Tax=Tetraselmis virus 1 TaxID=2060617 RepID=A0A2P0VMT7_9VIRU|nr:hypothetical protein QJ968_gp114 [Tetraselmis virus 1]AUF82206.1 hypothetical protein TetV_114 [Tetraselmis virus 1]